MIECCEYSHIHLPIADLIEPCPSEGILAVGHSLRERDIKFKKTMTNRLASVFITLATFKISRGIRRTTAHVAVKNLPTAFFGGLLISRN